MDDHLQQSADQHVCSHNDRRIGSAEDRPRGGHVREGRNVPVGKSDFFIAHLDVSKAAERPEVLGLWRDFVLRLSSTPVVSIAKIRGRTGGIGNEFALACDMRFASRQSALFGNPEIGVGLVPGGGALEWLPRLVGRSRALEIVLSGDDFDADIAE
ncbi:MAG: enoyl-CoA hydratase/isomerase family protein, partial [Acetobacteraceae bacterium]